MGTKALRPNRRNLLHQMKDSVTDRELFLSAQYGNALSVYARALAKEKNIQMKVDYNLLLESETAYTDGKQIYLNTGNCITNQLPDRKQKIRSHEGMVAHECGHIRFSDMNRRRTYVKGYSEGIIFPEPPIAGTAQDRKNWCEIRALLDRKDMAAIGVLRKLAADLNNILEDVYIEMMMSYEYQGSVRSALRMNADLIVSSIPDESLRKMKGDEGLAIMVDLILRYARMGRTEAERGYSKAYIRSLNQCRGIIDGAVVSQDPDSRFRAANQLILKLWKYVKGVISKAREELKDIPGEEMMKELEDFLEKNCKWVVLSEYHGEELGESGTEIPGWTGKPSTGKPDSAGGSGNSSDSSGDEDRNEDSGGEVQIGQEIWTQLNDFRSGQEEPDAGNDRMDITDRMAEILNRLAKEKLDRKEEQSLKERRIKEIQRQDLGDAHKGVRVEFHRNIEPGENALCVFHSFEPEIQKVVRYLEKEIEEILVHRDEGLVKGLYMGKRMDRSRLYRQDGKLFSKRILPDEGISLAVAILVDNSGSMDTAGRITCALKASMAIYLFCRRLDIPVMVYGHSEHISGYREIVDIYSYADFDSEDGQDYLRIAEMVTHDQNRDGAALRLAGNCLLKREEEVRLLILISDGLPNAYNYYGETARDDLKEIKRNLEKQGIQLFAAAIGEDKENIEEIYGDGFLNISDLKMMPMKLGKLLTQYIR